MSESLRSLLRWVGSFAIGLAVVYLLALACLYAFGWFEEESAVPRRTHVVDLLNEIERVRLKDELGLDVRRTRKIPPPPEPVVLPRQVSGFVQLEIEVGREGEVVNARVLGAVPEGFYEAQALEEVRQRNYEPSPIGTYRQAEVVPFTVTVDPAGQQADN